MSRAASLRRPHVVHAVRVALVATVVMAAVYVVLVLAFNAVDRQRLVNGVGDRLDSRLAAVAKDPGQAAAIAQYDNAHDLDDAPVFFWRVSPSGSRTALTPGAPRLSDQAWAPGTASTEARFGSANFLLRSRTVGSTSFVAAQTLASADRVASDLAALELVAGPVLLLGVFLGTLLIGVKAAEPVESARRRQLEFTADASHELRTPLSVIEAEVTLALSGRRTEDQLRDTLQRVGRESRRLTEIVENLLWLSRFDSAPPPPRDVLVDVGAISVSCADRFAALARQRGIALTVEVDAEGAPLVQAPPEWIDRLAAVLVDNACRYAGAEGTVRIGARASGHRVSLSVEDSGPGIAPEERGRLFERFHRATDLGNGAGLGLAIGDSVVKATGGTWHVGTSDLGGASMAVSWHRSPLGRRHLGLDEPPVPSSEETTGGPRPPSSAPSSPRHPSSIA
jgi:two-component system, OmpR family, sensor histidine kinase CiaH